MKLRTDFELDEDDGHYAFANGSFEELEHDALAAHAMMRAITDAEDRWFVTQKAHTDWIKEKADELMREWGFTDASSSPE